MHTPGHRTAVILAGILLIPMAAQAGPTLAITSINGVATGTAYVSQASPLLTVTGLSIDPSAGIITLSVSDGVSTLTATGTPLEDGLVSLSVDTSALQDGPLTVMLADENGGSDTDALSGIGAAKDAATSGITDVQIASGNAVLTSSARASDLVTLRFTSDERLQTATVEFNGAVVAANTNSSAPPYAYFADYTVPSDAPEGPVSFELSYADAAGNGGTVLETDDGSSVIIDLSGPTVSLLGGDAVTLELGDAYAEQGANATDPSGVDGAVAVTGTVDTNTVGTYALTYTALDLLGHASTATRTVTVTERARSSGSGGGGRRTNADDGGAAVNPDGEVLGAAAYSFARHLKQGDTGEDVTELQSLLGTLGYFGGAPTGYFGPVTASALKAYQTASGLEAVGYIGPRTLALLNQGTVSTDPRAAALIVEIARLRAEIARLSGVY